MPTVAFLTLANPEGYTIDDHIAAELLKRHGWEVDTIPWTTKGVDWSAFDAVIVRSAWDYFLHLDRFFDVLVSIEGSDTRLFNDFDVIRWNADKRYLGDLAERGVEVVPTIYGRALERGDVHHFAALLESEELVIKPVVSANAMDTFRFTADSEQEAALTRFERDNFIVQPFVTSIATDGEVSLFYFGHEFSHAIRKTPKSGDFRVQEEHGGRIVAWNPDTAALEAGSAVLGALDAHCLYARVDLVRGNDTETWWLMELELIEPSMYFRMDETAADRFRVALEKALG